MTGAQVVFATRNAGKVAELAQLMAGSGLSFLSLSELPGAPEVIEDGETFAENAAKKAREIAIWSGFVALADDSGLEVDALNGAPGVRSARYAGEHAGDAENNAKLLAALAAVPADRRTARFVSVIAIATPDGRVRTARGTCEGSIGDEPRGEDGFGYDPLFYVPECGLTYAELDLATKNRISHRGRAFREARQLLLDAVSERG